ncbi:hypothetical protein H0G86_012229 [Trichoderma simmonsii]|uniref:Uncharacterized protein n=1 Tax=Trichoderma simmonsii TaxID=1491479 RepID=A0A8G0PQQ4_9HYPO|nr:hypothetical protein H0G86_012229 [Trichoderma simmonsii]
MPASSVSGRVLRSNTRRRASPLRPLPLLPLLLVLLVLLLLLPNGLVGLAPLLPSLSLPTLSEGEGYLDEDTSFGEENRGEITESICRAAADRTVIPNGDLDQAEVPEGQWAPWDPAVDRDWEEFIDNLQTARLKDDRIHKLSKPSGPRAASLCCLWHYPTYRTGRWNNTG